MKRNRPPIWKPAPRKQGQKLFLLLLKGYQSRLKGHSFGVTVHIPDEQMKPLIAQIVNLVGCILSLFLKRLFNTLGWSTGTRTKEVSVITVRNSVSTFSVVCPHAARKATSEREISFWDLRLFPVHLLQRDPQSLPRKVP
jgi:hypothetical protein